jgi:iron(II)-dependent oxidoreductase
MGLGPYRTSALSEQDKQQRRRLLSMTLITCLVLALIGGTIHVVMLGKLRLGDMRRMATYDLSEESTRVRAAGEEITLHQKHETGPVATGYNVVEAQRLVDREQWEDLDRMVLVPAGRFIMGTDLERADEQDKPRHVVVLPPYYLDRYLVTNAQYARFVAATGRRAPLNWKGGRIPQGELLKPVSMVTWDDAAGYCAWAGRRLPHEAEFEKAGRGTDGRRWPWGDKMDPARLITYYNVGSSTNVTTYPEGASIYGRFDLSGNVEEWMADDMRPYDGSKAPLNSAVGNAPGESHTVQIGDYKVLRGGSWKGDPFSTSLYHRDYAAPNHATDFYGFRCASSSEPSGRGPQ